MATKITTSNLLPDDRFICFVIPGLFSADECRQLQSHDVPHPFEQANKNYPTYYRNNERLVVDDKVLASRLFEKVRPYLPEVITVDASIASENGTWHLQGLNYRLRYCRYKAGQYFHRHLDGVHYRDEQTQSKLTFMIYLNSATDFEGGRTLFFKTKDSADIWAAYTPQQGDLIVFDHNVWHEGEVLTSGEKYVLRSDILYAKTTATKTHQPFSGHLGYIWSLLRADDHTIISGGRDKTIRGWDHSGNGQFALQGHEHSILCMERLTDDVFLSGSRDQQIIVWHNREIVCRISIHNAIVLSLCRLGPRTFASAGGDHLIRIADIGGNILQTLHGHSNWVWKVFLLDEGRLASASEDGTIRIWDISTGTCMLTFQEGTPVISLAYHHKTRQLISGSLDGLVSVRVLAEEEEQVPVRRFEAHSGIIRTIRFIDDRRIATGGEDNKVKIWTTDGRLCHSFAHHNFVQAIELIDEHTLLSASYDGTIQTWKI